MKKPVFPERKCDFLNCENVFTPKSGASRYCDKKHLADCSRCSSRFELHRNNQEEILCGKCRQSDGGRKASDSIFEKYGVRSTAQVPEIKEKIRQTNLKRYGSTSPFGDSEVKKKVEQTNLERYGVKKPFQSDKIQAKAEKTFQKKYGVDRPFQSDEMQSKMRESTREKYGMPYPAQNKEIKEKIKQTNLERYGVESNLQLESVKQAQIRASQEKYGTDYPLQSEQGKKDFSEKLREKYNVEWAMQSPEIQEKAKDTYLERYGALWAIASDEVKEKRKQTLIERYGVEHQSELDWVKEKIAASREKSAAGGLINYPQISKINKSFKDLFENTFNLEVDFEKKMGNLSIDLHLNNVFVEINPTFTHNSEKAMVCVLRGCEYSCVKHQPYSSIAHFEKAVLAKDLGKSLVQIYDWDSKDKVIQLLSGKLERKYNRISARKCRIQKITQKEANKFLDENHIQGATKKQSHCYGLLYEDELLAVATFGKSRFNKKYDWEFIRYAIKHKNIVHGASGKLFKEFLKEVKPLTVISYVDFNHTTMPRIFLNSIGFKEIKPTGPQLMWSKKKERIYNNSLLKQGADRLLNTNYGKPKECGFNNEQIMLLEGWLPVYTAGNRVFVWNRPKNI